MNSLSLIFIIYLHTSCCVFILLSCSVPGGFCASLSPGAYRVGSTDLEILSPYDRQDDFLHVISPSPHYSFRDDLNDLSCIWYLGRICLFLTQYRHHPCRFLFIYPFVSNVAQLLRIWVYLHILLGYMNRQWGPYHNTVVVLLCDGKKKQRRGDRAVLCEG